MFHLDGFSCGKFKIWKSQYWLGRILNHSADVARKKAWFVFISQPWGSGWTSVWIDR